MICIEYDRSTTLIVCGLQDDGRDEEAKLKYRDCGLREGGAVDLRKIEVNIYIQGFDSSYHYVHSYRMSNLQSFGFG